MSDLLRIGGLAPPAPGRMGLLWPELPSAFSEPLASSAQFPRFHAELQRALAQTSFRVARVADIRAEIERGEYDTPERIQGTVERVLDLLG